MKKFFRGILGTGACAGVLAVAAAGCGRDSEKAAGPVLARVGGEVITQGDFLREWAAQGAGGMLQPGVDTPDNFLNDMVIEKLIVQEAVSQGIDREPAFRQEVENFRSQLLVQKFLEREVLSIPAPAEEEVAAYYAADPGKFEVPELVRVSLIMISPGEGEEAAAAGARAVQTRGRILGGEDFAAVAAEFASGPASERGGDMGYFRPGQLPVELEQAAWSLETGLVSEPISGETGYFLITVTDRKSPRVRGLDECRDTAAQALMAQRRKDAFDALERRLKAKNPPVIDQDLLSQVRRGVAATSP